jgi:hypothetical protein
MTRHRKVIAADQKYSDALETSGKKLDTAIRKTLLSKPSGKQRVSVHDRQKWEAIAVNTKRAAFGKKVFDDYMQQAEVDPKVAQQAKSLDLKNPKSSFRTVLRAKARKLHMRIVADAYERGVTIAPEVLAEYPDLARPKIDLTSMDKAQYSHSKWLKWELDKPPILLNPQSQTPEDRAYLVQDRTQRKSTEKGWDYSIVDAALITFPGAENINTLILHKSTKTPGTMDISEAASGQLLFAQSNPLDRRERFIENAKEYIQRDPEGFDKSIEGIKRLTIHYPHMYDLFHKLNVAKTGKRKYIDVGSPKFKSELGGVGNVLQAANLISALARLAGEAF